VLICVICGFERVFSDPASFCAGAGVHPVTRP